MFSLQSPFLFQSPAWPGPSVSMRSREMPAILAVIIFFFISEINWFSVFKCGAMERTLTGGDFPQMLGTGNLGTVQPHRIPSIIA